MARMSNEEFFERIGMGGKPKRQDKAVALSLGYVSVEGKPPIADMDKVDFTVMFQLWGESSRFLPAMGPVRDGAKIAYLLDYKMDREALIQLRESVDKAIAYLDGDES